MKINKEKQEAVPQKLLHELFDYNPETGKWTNKTTRCNRARVGQPSGSLSKDGYVVIRINGYIYLAHRLAWAYVYGDYPEGGQPFIDHINGNPSDNRIENLKVSSSGENNKNAKMKSNNKSGFAGARRCGLYNNSKKNPKINYYWVASWYDENGKLHNKYFPIHELGEEQAKQTAINYRVERIRLLELNYGIIYSGRHGTKKS